MHVAAWYHGTPAPKLVSVDWQDPNTAKFRRESYPLGKNVSPGKVGQSPR